MSRALRHTTHTDITIESTDHKGNGIARIGTTTVIVPFTLVGEVVDIHIERTRKKHAFARVLKRTTDAANRIPSLCQHFMTCGGCSWHHATYATELEAKQRHVANTLSAISAQPLTAPDEPNAQNPSANLTLSDKPIAHLTKPIIGSPTQTDYRNRLDFSVSHNRWLTADEIASDLPLNKIAVGFHKAGRYDKIVHIERCWLQADPSTAIKQFFYQQLCDGTLQPYNTETHSGDLKNITIRIGTDHQVMLIVTLHATTRIDIAALITGCAKHIPQITSIYYCLSDKRHDGYADSDVIHAHGTQHIVERYHTITCEVYPKTFLQTNSTQAERLYTTIIELAAIQPHHVIYDLYCGIGPITLLCAQRARFVWGVEEVHDSIASAYTNAQRNHIDNVHFTIGSVETTLHTIPPSVAQHGTPDTVIIDPPRAGVNPKALAQLRAVRPARIIYVSCNVTTQARDIAALIDLYAITAVQPIDMFPRTAHVEVVVALELRK